jgi:beta-carotene 3-hydroxylase
VLAAAAAMELVAWASHKYVMHGFGWAWHRDHHEPHDGFFERNDLYAVVGAAISISMFAIGSPLMMGAHAWWPGTWVGMGVLVYGLIYTFIHDGLVHQRWFRWVPKRGYAKRLVQAHRLHHATIGKEGGSASASSSRAIRPALRASFRPSTRRGWPLCGRQCKPGRSGRI